MAGESSRALGPIEVAITDSDRNSIPSIMVNAQPDGELSLAEIVKIVQAIKQYPPGTPILMLFYVDFIQVYGAFWVQESRSSINDAERAKIPLRLHAYEYNQQLWATKGMVYTARRIAQHETISVLKEMAKQSIIHRQHMPTKKLVPEHYGTW